MDDLLCCAGLGCSMEIVSAEASFCLGTSFDLDTTHATLECPPWSDADLPKLSAPTDSQRTTCTSSTLDLIDWIRSSEVTIFDRLGIEHRRSTLLQWDNGYQSLRRSRWRRPGGNCRFGLPLTLTPIQGTSHEQRRCFLSLL